MNSYRKLVVTFLGVLCFHASFSQENYLPGYVIRSKGDTLRGLIDYRNWNKNPDVISFKEKIDFRSTIYSTADIIEFGVKGEIYLRGVVDVESSLPESEGLKANAEIHIKVDTVFLQTLVKGVKSLYYYKSSESKENFYIANDTTFELLIYKKFLIEKGGRPIIAENRKYIRQLVTYLNDCPSIQSKFSSTKYKQESIKKLFQLYYKCFPSEAFFKKEHEKILVETGLLAGVTLNFMEFSSDASPSLADAHFDSPTSFSGGVFFDLVLPRNQRKWSIYNELLYTSYEFTGQSVYTESQDIYTLTTTKLGSTFIRVNNFLRFKYPIGKFYTYLNAGISTGFSFNTTNSKKTESIIYSSVFTFEQNALPDTRKYENAFMLGLGSKYNKFSFEVRYETGNGLTQHMKTQKCYFLVGYRF